MRIEKEIRKDFAQLRRASISLNTLPAMAKRHLTTAELTPMYVAAKKQLATLSKVDEIKDIADKHSAIAHYAKQIQDKSLLYYAERVYNRALERIGDLMRELGTAKERTALAKEHGISPSVAQSAYVMSHLPRRALDALIEKTPPASRGELEVAGRKLMPEPTRREGRRAGEGFRRYTAYQEPFGKSQYVIDVCLDAIHESDRHRQEGTALDQRALVSGLTVEERNMIRQKLRPIIEWLDKFDQLLEGRSL